MLSLDRSAAVMARNGVAALAATIAVAAGGDVSAEAPARWTLHLRAVEDGASLDLDPTPDEVPELASEKGDIVFARPRRRDSTAAVAFPGTSDAAVWRTTTSTGLPCWVQVVEAARAEDWLRFTSPPRQATVRWLVGPPGSETVIAPPAECSTAGSASSVQLRLPESAPFARLEVEHRIGLDGPWSPRVVARDRVYVVDDVPVGTRVCFRIVGVTADGRESAPREVAGAPGVSGVRSGSVLVDRSLAEHVNVDLVAGRVVERDGDVRGLDRMRDACGRIVAPCIVVREGWDREWPGRSAAPRERHLPSMQWATLPLRGGGIARVRIVEHARQPELRWFSLVWDLVLDRAEFEVAAGLTAVSRDGSDVVRHTGCDPGTCVMRLEPSEQFLRAAVEMRASSDGGHSVPEAVQNSEGRYRIAQSSFGRVGLPREAVRSPPGAGFRSGEFELAHGDGYAFANARVVRGQPADLYLLGVAGGGASVRLHAPLGITSPYCANGALDLDFGQRSVRDAVAAVDGAVVRLFNHVGTDSRIAGSDVLVMPVQAGGWCKLWQLDRRQSDVRGSVVRFGYVWNVDGDWFQDQSERSRWRVVGGIRFSQ